VWPAGKPLTLKGVGRPTLAGGLAGDTIRVVAEDVVIDGLIVTDSGDSLLDQNAGIYIQPGAHRAVVRNCDLAYNLFGLWIEKADDVRIENNLITGKRDYRVSAARQRHPALQHDRRTHHRQQHQLRARCDLCRCFAPRAVPRQPTAPQPLRHALHELLSQPVGGQRYLDEPRWAGADGSAQPGGAQQPRVGQFRPRHHAAHHCRTRWWRTTSWPATRGFFIYDAEYNTLRGNLVVDNIVGMHVWAGSKNNQVERNDFIATASRCVMWRAR
jgi:nitrous oxidase accessory protein